MSHRTGPGGTPPTAPAAGHLAEQDAEPYAEQYAEGRRAALAGSERDANPYFARNDDAAGHPESQEVWRSKYDVWRQGWMEGHSTVEPGPPRDR